MTKKELKNLMEEYIARQDCYNKDELYCTQYDIVADVLKDFAEELGIVLEE